MSLQRATALSDELEQRNRVRAEPVMRAVAERRGAVLLPNQPEFISLGSCEMFGAHAGPPPVLPPASGWGGPHYPCMVSGGDVGPTRRILGADGKVRTAVLILKDHPGYARLAKRGNVLFLLAAAASDRRVGGITVCECEGGEDVVEPGVTEEMAFILDEMPVDRVEEVRVPITVEFLEWKCKIIAG